MVKRKMKIRHGGTTQNVLFFSQIRGRARREEAHGAWTIKSTIILGQSMVVLGEMGYY